MEREDESRQNNQDALLPTPLSIRETCGPQFYKLIQIAPFHSIEMTSFGDLYGEIKNYRNGYVRTTRITEIKSEEGRFFSIHETLEIPSSAAIHSYYLFDQNLFLKPSSTSSTNSMVSIGRAHGFLSELLYLQEVQTSIRTAIQPTPVGRRS